MSEDEYYETEDEFYEDYEIIDSDAWEMKKDMINMFQELSGRTLTEASPETLIFSTVAYLLALREENYNDVVKQNYLRYARDERLNLRGEIYGTRGARLEEQAAQATFRFYIATVQATDIVIPKGSRIQYNELYFETDEEYKILKGNLFVDGIATCTTTGVIGNNIPVGQIKSIVDIYPHYDKVENITATNGGNDVETDESYRERIREIPESFTTAGSTGAYEFWTKTASQSIIDVKVVSPNPCEVDIYIWSDIGQATQELKDRVLNVVNSEEVRPLTDKVKIKDPNIINYTLNFSYFIDKENESMVSIIKENVEKEVLNYINWQKSKISRDINTDELIKRLKLIGVKRVIITSPSFQKLEFNEVAVCNSTNIDYQGVEEL